MDSNKKSFLKGAIYGAVSMLCVILIGVTVFRVVTHLVQPGATSVVGVTQNYSTEQKLKQLGRIVQSQYLFLDDVDLTAVEDGLYQGYIDALGDVYTTYYNKEQTKELMESATGEYYGIGVVMSQDATTGTVTIINVYEGMPGDLAGLQAGDILVGVDDQVITAENISEIVNFVKGEEGTQVTLHVLRGESMEEVTCVATRGLIEAHTVESEMLEGNCGYIRVTEFDGVTYEQFKAALEALQEQDAQSLIIDLRSNPGGDMEVTVDMLKLLLPKGVIVSTKDRAGNTQEYKNSKDSGFDLPLVVLVNGYSASASEIFSGAIQDYGVGQILGTTTYGKGIVQKLFYLDDDTCLKVTNSEYFTPNGRNIHGIGITPDVEIAYELDSENPEADNQLEKALELLQP